MELTKVFSSPFVKLALARFMCKNLVIFMIIKYLSRNFAYTFLHHYMDCYVCEMVFKTFLNTRQSE
jgi:hypothetical protein